MIDTANPHPSLGLVLASLCLVGACVSAPQPTLSEGESSTSGDGDPDPSGDGDGDGDPAGDGDGDRAGDGDGDLPGDGDGDSDPCAIVEFDNPALEQTIRAVLELPGPEPLSGSELELLGELMLEGDAAQELGGLECALGLGLLELVDASPASLAPLADLPSLSFVALRDVVLGDPQDSAVIAQLPMLTDLSMSRVSGFDLDALAVASVLDNLLFRESELDDLAPLAAIPSLESVNLRDNLITELAPLAQLPALRRLDLSQNQISQIDALAGLGLTDLTIFSNAIENLDALAGDPSLGRLQAASNQITAVVEMPVLEYLDLQDNPLVDISALANHSVLTFVNFDDTQVEELDALANIETLTTLYASGCALTQLPTDLFAERILLSSNALSSLEGIETWAKPIEWGFGANMIEDLSPLAAVSWTLEPNECAFVTVSGNPLGDPANPAIATAACVAPGMTVVADDMAIDCAPVGCEFPAP